MLRNSFLNHECTEFLDPFSACTCLVLSEELQLNQTVSSLASPVLGGNQY
jgi:hypothetical protein